MAKARLRDEYGNDEDDEDVSTSQPVDEEAPPPLGSGPEYPGATRDRQGPGGAQEAENRRIREEQARKLNQELGVDGGNLESFLSGRNTYDNYLADQRARTTNTPGGDSERRVTGPGVTNGGGDDGAAGAYQQYLSGGQQVQAQAPQAPQSDPMLAALVARLEADATRQDQERAQMRELVMSQLGDATAPVSADNPGIKPIIDAQKVALQRGTQRQRSAAVERAGVRGLGDSGALDTRINQIEQGRGESESAMIGQILNNELTNKRQQVMQLLDLATRSGDAEAARTLQGQLQTLDQQMTQNRFGQDLGFRNRALDVQDNQFGRDLGFRERAFDTSEASQRYRFDNDLGWRIAQAQLLGDQNATSFLEGLLRYGG